MIMLTILNLPVSKHGVSFYFFRSLFLSAVLYIFQYRDVACFVQFIPQSCFSSGKW